MILRRGTTRYKHYVLGCFYVCLMGAVTLWTFKRGEYDLTILNMLGVIGFVYITIQIRQIIDKKENANIVRRYTRQELIIRLNQIEADFENQTEDLTSNESVGYAKAIRDVKTKIFQQHKKA